MNPLRSCFVVTLVWTTLFWRTAQANTAVDPVPRTDNGWQQRQDSMNAIVASTGADAEVVFIGDSITQGWEGEGKEVWSRFYAPRHAINLGIGGDRTQHVLWRLYHGNLKGLRPKVAVVMIGTNNSNGEDNTVAEIAEGIAAIVSKLRTSLPDTRVLLLAIFPRGEKPNAQRGKLCQINQVLQKLDDGTHVDFLDLGHRFLNADGTLPREIMPDFLHLSPAGYRIWAEAMEPKLASLLATAPSPPAGLLTGDWIWTINGPDGQPISAPLQLAQSGNSVTGQFSAGPDRWLKIENGKVEGTRFSWTVRRTRPNGETAVYEMSGEVAGNAISGKTRTTLDGNEATSTWTARRK
jgi:beta-glucosidase